MQKFLAQIPKPWMSKVLLLAGIYNILWGAVTIVFPHWCFDWAGMPRLNYPEIWQCVGMIVGVYGVGYAAASLNPYRHWPIVLVGLMGKVFGPLGFAKALWEGTFPPKFGVQILTNDLIWWIPFALILKGAYQAFLADSHGISGDISRFALQATTNQGQKLGDLTRSQPIMLVFLRHFGCTFCREALNDLAEQRREIESRGIKLVLVHMGSESAAREFFARYGLDDVARVADPNQSLYRGFGLTKGSLWQLFGPEVWWRGFTAGILRRNGIGFLVGDGFQMPGAFLLFHGEVLRAFRHKNASDRPDYRKIATLDEELQAEMSA
jgi:peroxiredoxin